MGKLELIVDLVGDTELCELGRKFGTDKCQHGYTKIYHEVLKDKRNDVVDIFEIGIYMGNSIKMWHEFFPFGKIFGIDNGRLLPGTSIMSSPNESPSYDDKRLLAGDVVSDLSLSWLENDRIKCYIADQRDEIQLNNAMSYFGCDKFDMILDDGQHYIEHQLKSFNILFKNVKPGGYYIIEDISHIDDLLFGCVGYEYPQFWGQKREDCKDCTYYVFNKYIDEGVLESDYITDKNIIDDIDDIFMFDGGSTRLDGTKIEPNAKFLRGSSRTLVIKKKLK